MEEEEEEEQLSQIEASDKDEKQCMIDKPPSPNISKQFRILVTSSNLSEDALTLLQESCEIHILPILKDDKLLVRYTQGMEGLLIDNPEIHIDKEFLRAAGLGLKVISIVSHTGVQVNMQEASKRKIKVGVCSSDLALNSSAEVSIGLALALCRRVKEGNNSLMKGTVNLWNPEWLLGQDLKNCVCGIIGLGKLGSSIAIRLQGFSPKKIIYYSRRDKKVGYKMGIERILLDDLLEVSDIIFLCLPCNSITRGMFNEELFIKMKRSSILINTSHGGLVNINNLYCALRKGVIFGAGMDTEITDAPSKRHPIHRLDNFLLLPSVSRNSAMVKQRMYVQAVENLISGLVNKKMLLPWCPREKEEIVETEEERLIRVQKEEEERERIEKEEIYKEWEEKLDFGEEEMDGLESKFNNEESDIHPDWSY